MKALAIYPFNDGFKAVFRSMERACQQFSNGDTDVDPALKERLAQVTCEEIGQKDGATFDIVKNLLDAIKSCDFCIADLTDNNINVSYELGFAMALEKPVILLTQDLKKLPFDLQGLKVIKYDRTNLDQTVEQPLVAAIKEIAKHIADVPALTLHAKSLALSTSSATYFLDSDYRIHYMNEAAAELFATSRNGGGKSWIDSSLREFINEISYDLENLPAIEKNLQIQTEEIHRLEAAGKSTDIPSCNIEPIILNSAEYGRLELQKTGVAVRDPSTDRITGWVVSFNVVKAHEPVKYEQFHVNHKLRIKALMGGSQRRRAVQERRPQKERQIWSDNSRIERWIRADCPSPKLRIAGEYSEKQACFNFCTSVMKGDTRRYGLESVEFLDEWFFDFKQAEYILMHTPDDDLVGVFRLHKYREVTTYKDISEWVLDAAGEEQAFADVGAYLHPAIDGPPRAACLAKMLGRAARLGERHQQVFLYCQVPTYLERFFDAFLFEKAGKPFVCKGWRQPSVVPQSEVILSSVARARPTLARMSSA